MVEFKNITKIYDNLISAVYDVSFKLTDGEFVFLIGPSGSGKTTVIKMLIRDEVPTGGHIFFNDVDITKISRNKVYKLRREIGVVFQDFKLVPDKTAYENVAFAMEAAGKKNKEIKDTVPYVLDIVGLSNRMKAFPKQLSGGEQQRVAIARAIANNPKILIADEPTGNLDPASSWDIVQVLTKINNWGTTVIMSTHGTDIVNSLNKRVIQMEKGRIIRDDNKGQYELVKNYEEENAKNLDNSEVKKESKKKVYQVKIKKDVESPTQNNSELQTQGEQELPLVVKTQSSFFKLLNNFRKHRDKEVQPSIIETLSEKPIASEMSKESISEGLGKADKAEIEENEQKSQGNNSEINEAQPNAEVAKEEAPSGMKFNLKESAKMAKSQKKDQSDEDLGKAIDKTDQINIDDMNLPKSVKMDLKAAGYKTVQDLVNAGPDALAKNLVIDPEEVILISKEIKKLIE